MSIFEGVVLGTVQGLTEFLPISSSGHLILIRDWLQFSMEHGLAFDAVLQLATALAVLIYFRADFWNLLRTGLGVILRRDAKREEKILLYALILGTIPAVLLGLLLESYMETLFRNALLVAGTLFAGAIMFLLAERYGSQIEMLTAKKGLLIGFFQALALIPGMSRSGMTIAGGLFLGLSREKAARFGFLLAFPIIFGSGMKKLFELWSDGYLIDHLFPVVGGSITAFAVGLVVIHYLLIFLRTHTLFVFAMYRMALATLIVLIVFLS